MSERPAGVLPRAGALAPRAGRPPPSPAGGGGARRAARPAATRRSSATRASSSCPSGARRRSSRCATRACSWSAPARSARRSPPTWPARASGGSGSSTTTPSSSRTSTASRCTSRPTSACRRPRARRPSCASSTPRSWSSPTRRASRRAMLEGADLVVDCSDSFATRYEVNAACCAARTPLVEGGVVGLSGLVMAIRPGESACYRCAFPEAPPPGAAPSCAEAGVLGPAAGVIGSLQALEALKLLGGPRRRAARRLPPGRPLRPRLPARGRHAPGRTARTVARCRA